MDSNKRRSLLRKKTENVEGSESKNRPKRRISFSGKKAVREFSKENEAKAWDHSYEVSDHAIFDDQQQPEIAIVVESHEESTVKGGSDSNNLAIIKENNSDYLNFNVSQDVTLLPQERGIRAIREVGSKSASSLCVEDSISVSFSLLDKDTMQLGCFKKSLLKEQTIDYMHDLSALKRDFSIIKTSIKKQNMEQMDSIPTQTLESCPAGETTNLKKVKCDLHRQNAVDMDISHSHLYDLNKENIMPPTFMNMYSNINNAENEKGNEEMEGEEFASNEVVNKRTELNTIIFPQENDMEFSKIINPKTNAATKDLELKECQPNYPSSQSITVYNMNHLARKSSPIKLPFKDFKSDNVSKNPGSNKILEPEVEKSFSFHDFSLNTTSSSMSPEFLSCGKKYNLRQFNEDLEKGKIRVFCDDERTPIKRRTHFPQTKQILNDMEIENTQLIGREPICSTNEVNFCHGDITGIVPTKKLKSKKDQFRFSQADEMMLDNTNFLAQAKLGDESNSRNSSKSSTFCSRRGTVFYDEDIKCEINSNKNGNVDHLQTKADDIPSYYLNPEHLREQLNCFGAGGESQSSKSDKPNELSPRNQSEIGLDISMISNSSPTDDNLAADNHLDPLNSEKQLISKVGCPATNVNNDGHTEVLCKDPIRSKKNSRQSIYFAVEMEIDEDIADQAVSQYNGLYVPIIKNRPRTEETCYASESIEADIRHTIISNEVVENDGTKGNEVAVFNFPTSWMDNQKSKEMSFAKESDSPQSMIISEDVEIGETNTRFSKTCENEQQNSQIVYPANKRNRHTIFPYDELEIDEINLNGKLMAHSSISNSCKDNQMFAQIFRKTQRNDTIACNEDLHIDETSEKFFDTAFLKIDDKQVSHLNQKTMLDYPNMNSTLIDKDNESLSKPNDNFVNNSRSVELEHRQNNYQCSIGQRSSNEPMAQSEKCKSVSLTKQNKSNTLLLNEDLEVEENPIEALNNSFSQVKLDNYDVEKTSNSKQAMIPDAEIMKKEELLGQSVSMNKPINGRRGTIYIYEDIQLETTLRNIVPNDVENLESLTPNDADVSLNTAGQDVQFTNEPIIKQTVENLEISERTDGVCIKDENFNQNDLLELSSGLNKNIFKNKTVAGLQSTQQHENQKHTIVENNIVNLLNNNLENSTIFNSNDKEVKKTYNIINKQRCTIYGNEDLELVEQQLYAFEGDDVTKDPMKNPCKAQTTIYEPEDLDLDIVDAKNCILTNEDIKSTHNTKNIDRAPYTYEDIDLVTENMDNCSKIKCISYKEDKIKDFPISKKNNLHYDEKIRKSIDLSRRTIVFLDHNDMELDGVINSTSENSVKHHLKVNDQYTEDILENKFIINQNNDHPYSENNIQSKNFADSGNLKETKAQSISNLRRIVQNFKDLSYETPKKCYKTIEMTPHRKQRSIAESTPCRSLLDFEVMEKECEEDLLKDKHTGIKTDFHEYLSRKGLTKDIKTEDVTENKKNYRRMSTLNLREMDCDDFEGQTQNWDKENKDYGNACTNKRNSIEINKYESDCQIEEMDISNCHYIDTVTNFKRLSQNITPNLPLPKKRQTVLYHDCNVIEDTTIQTDVSIPKQDKLKNIKKIIYPDCLEIENNHNLRFENEFNTTDLKGYPQDINLTLNNSIKNSLLEPIEVPRRVTSVYQKSSVITNPNPTGGNDHLIVKNTENSFNQVQEIQKNNEHAEISVKKINPLSSEVLHNPVGCSISIGSDNEDRNIAKYYNITLSGKDTEDIDKTHLSLVETILDDTLHEPIKQICIPEEYQELKDSCSKNNDQEKNSLKNGTITKLGKNDAPFCRKCKGCEEPFANESDFSLINTEKYFSKFALPNIKKDGMSKLRKQPTIRDIIRSRMRKSLEKAMIISDSEDEMEDLQNQPSVKDIIRREMVASADRIAKLEKSFRFSHNDADETIKHISTDTITYVENSTEEMHRKIDGIKLLLTYLRTPQKSFIERLQNLLKPNAPNWIFNYRLQSLNKLVFYHKKIQTSLIEINYEELDNGANIGIKSTKLRRNGFAFKYWLPIHHVMEFQLQLELPYQDLNGYCSGNDELSICDMLSRFDQVFMCVRKMIFTFWRIIMREDATLIRDGPFCYIRKTVRKSRDLDSDVYLDTHYSILIVIKDLTKLCYKDIVIPRLHLIDESITEIPIGLEFLSTFLGNPLRFMKLEKIGNQAFL